MIIQGWLIIWVAIGGISFVLTENYLRGWAFLKTEIHPFKIMISACLLGPITTIFCIYAIVKIKRREKTENYINPNYYNIISKK